LRQQKTRPHSLEQNPKTGIGKNSAEEKKILMGVGDSKRILDAPARNAAANGKAERDAAAPRQNEIGGSRNEICTGGTPSDRRQQQS
jgi:hypothetical protein